MMAGAAYVRLGQPDSRWSDANPLCLENRATTSPGELSVVLRRFYIMKQRHCSMVLGLGLLVGIFITAQRVQATLGESADSVETDRQALLAMRGANTVHDGYTIHDIHSDSIVVREYVSKTGVVFGIAWKGLIYPDLTPLLGSYANEYKEALRKAPRQYGRHPLQVKTTRVVVEEWGHMRNLQGRAYSPALIPPGVSVDEIK